MEREGGQTPGPVGGEGVVENSQASDPHLGREVIPARIVQAPSNQNSEVSSMSSDGEWTRIESVTASFDSSKDKLTESSPVSASELHRSISLGDVAEAADKVKQSTQVGSFVLLDRSSCCIKTEAHFGGHSRPPLCPTAEVCGSREACDAKQPPAELAHSN